MEAMRVVFRPVLYQGRFSPGMQSALTGRRIVGLRLACSLLQEQLGKSSSLGDRQRFCVGEEILKLRYENIIAASVTDSKMTL
jgi:hypothetical protein